MCNKQVVPFLDFNSLNDHLLVPVVYDEANEHRRLTKRLIIKMKKRMRVIGDVPKHLYVDGSQFFDLENPEDYAIRDIKEDFGLEVDCIDRPRRYKGDTCEDPEGRNRFCIMTGEAGRVVIGAYPAAIVKAQ